MSTLEIIHELESLSVIVICDDDEHLAEALDEIGVEREGES